MNKLYPLVCLVFAHPLALVLLLENELHFHRIHLLFMGSLALIAIFTLQNIKSFSAHIKTQNKKLWVAKVNQAHRNVKVALASGFVLIFLIQILRGESLF